MAPPRASNVDPTTGRKKLKTSDLPLSSATRTSIDQLAHQYKKKGQYDSLRKDIWQNLQADVSLALAIGDILIEIFKSDVCLHRGLKTSSTNLC
jgi:hypothetical protein